MRPSTRRVAVAQLVAGRLEHAPLYGLAQLRRRQPERLLGELRGSPDRAAPGGLLGGLVEGDRDLLGRPVGAQGKVPSTLLAADQLGQSRVHAPSRRWRQQASSRPRRGVGARSAGGRRRRIRGHPRAVPHRQRRPRRPPRSVDGFGSESAETTASSSWAAARQPAQPAADRFPERGGQRQRGAGLDRRRLVGERAGQLQGVERVAARCAGDAFHHAVRKRRAEPFADDVVQRVRVEWPNAHALELVAVALLERIDERQPLSAVRFEPPRGEDRHPSIGQAAHGKGERFGRSLVDPLQVVDRQQHRAVVGQQAQRGQAWPRAPCAARPARRACRAAAPPRARGAAAPASARRRPSAWRRARRPAPRTRAASRRSPGSRQGRGCRSRALRLAMAPERRLAHARFGLEQQGGGRGRVPWRGRRSRPARARGQTAPPPTTSSSPESTTTHQRLRAAVPQTPVTFDTLREAVVQEGGIPPI